MPPADLMDRVPAARTTKRSVHRSRFYVVMVALMTALVVAGFWPSYFGPLVRGSAARHWVVHLHGAVFSGWMALLMTQVLLVVRGRTALHRQVGRFGILYGVLVVVTGLAVSVVAPVLHVQAGEWDRDRAAGFFLITLGDMVLFSGLFGAAVAYRRTPEVHKRLIMLSTIALLFAAVGRLPLGTTAAFLLLWLLPLFVAMAHDWWTRRSIHAVYIAGAFILPLAAARIYLEQSEAWLPVGRAILELVLPALAVSPES